MDQKLVQKQTSKVVKDNDLKEREKAFKQFNDFVKEARDWFDEILKRRSDPKGSLSPLEKAIIMNFDTVVNQYITDKYKFFNLVTLTKNYHKNGKIQVRQETPVKKTTRKTEKKL